MNAIRLANAANAASGAFDEQRAIERPHKRWSLVILDLGVVLTTAAGRMQATMLVNFAVGRAGAR